jgi:ATP-dependent DNA helicase PIF1
MELSKEQQYAFDKYIQGQNIFITGPAGTGKSELIKKIYYHAITHFKKIQVCALTGCAAVLLNCKARTLHSWAGIGLGNHPIDSLIKKINRNKTAKMCWQSIDVLVVDEVSMFSLQLFDMLNEIGKKIRKNNSPFGGIQLIFSGDFYQLPPIGNKDDPDTQKFCFESLNWNIVFPNGCQIRLLKIFRQADQSYSDMLNQIREGKFKKKTIDIFMSLLDRTVDSNLITEPTKLFPTRSKVDIINNSKMNMLSSIEKQFKLDLIKMIPDISTFERIQRAPFDEKDIEYELDYLKNNILCENLVRVKIGAQVMSIINMQTDEGFSICNGSQGVVKGFCTETGFPIVKFNNGVELVMKKHTWMSEKIPGVAISQVPLILAWALTIHKSQGATLDCAEIDVGSDIFECGQTYVALSRVKDIKGLYLKSFDVNKIRINKKVRDFYASFKDDME